MIYFSGIIELIASINPCPEQHISIILILNTSFFFIVSFSLETLCRLVYTRGSEWGDPLVGCRLKFSNFVGSRLKFSIFVGSRLNFSIFAGYRKISVNK